MNRKIQVLKEHPNRYVDVLITIGKDSFKGFWTNDQLEFELLKDKLHESGVLSEDIEKLCVLSRSEGYSDGYEAGQDENGRR